MAIDVKEYAAFTGVTEGYAAEILKDAEHAKWHIPSGAAKLEKAAELMADMEDTEKEEAVKPEEEPIVVPGNDQGEGAGEGTEPGTGEETGPDGGSVEGEA